MSLSPYLRGQRMYYLTRELPPLVAKAGGSFGAILAFGGKNC